MKNFILLGAALLSVAWAQKQQYTTPVPILKQINKHNEDGSYSYGYEGADGTFKIETKYADGQVYGKYGYVDDAGKVREVEYGASRRGFEPAGNDIQVAPPTLNKDNEYAVPLRPGEEDDGQYREDPSVYYKDDKYNTQPAYQQQQQQQPQTYRQPQAYTRPQTYQQPAYQPPQPVYQPQQQTYRQPQPAFRPEPQSNFDFDSFRSNLGFSQPKAQPVQQPRPQPRPQPQPVYNTGYNNGYYNRNYNNNYNSGYSHNYNTQPAYQNHPNLPYNVDLNTGSYTLNVGR